MYISTINRQMQNHLVFFMSFLFIGSCQAANCQVDTLDYHKWYTMAEKATAESKLDRAKQLYRLALENSKNVYHKLKATRKLSTCYYLLSQLDSAENIIASNLLMDPNKLLDVEVVELAESYYRIVRALSLKQGDQKKARNAIEKAIALLKSRNVSPYKYAGYYVDLGITYWNFGDYDSALYTYDKALTLLGKFDNISTEKDKVRAYIATGLVYWNRRELKKASDHYQLALSVIARNPSAYPRDYTITCNNVALLFAESGKYDSAIHYSQKALASINALKGTPYESFMKVYRAQFSNTLAIAYLNHDDLALAESILIQSLKILTTNRDDVLQSKVYLNLGTCYRKQKRWTKSLMNLQKGLSLKKQIFGQRHHEVSKAYNLLGYLFLDQGKFKESSSYFDSAALSNPKVTIDGISVYSSIEEIWISISGNIECLIKQKAVSANKNKIESLFQDVKSQLSYSYIHTQDEALMSDIQVLFGRLFLAYYELYQKDHNQEFLKRLWEIAEYKKGLKLNNQLNSSIALHTLIPKSLFEQEQKLRDSLSDLTNSKMMSKSNPTTDSTLLVKRSRYDVLVKKIESQYPRYFALRYALPNTDLQKVRRSLNQSESILNYFETPEKFFSIFVNTDTAFALSYNADINKFIEAMNEGIITNKLNLLKENARKLQILIPDLSINISNQSNLVVIPDGQIWNVQFTLLPGYKSNSFLGQELNISYRYAFNDYVFAGKKNNNNRKVLAFSASDHIKVKPGTYHSSFRNVNSDLPGTSTEITQIASVRDGDYYFGQGATETVFKQKAKHYQILHLAMHGELNLEEPNYSNLRFMPPDTINDGRLHAFEVYSLSLSADLAVLSACNSGHGKIQEGDGIVSLGRAFSFAGVSSLLISKWAVSDVTAPVIMKYFYEGLENGASKSESLRLAKLKFLKFHADNITSSPYYWDSFYILGNDRPIEKNRNMLSTIIMGLVCIIILASMLVTINRKKRTI